MPVRKKKLWKALREVGEPSDHDTGLTLREGERKEIEEREKEGREGWSFLKCKATLRKFWLKHLWVLGVKSPRKGVSFPRNEAGLGSVAYSVTIGSSLWDGGISTYTATISEGGNWVLGHRLLQVAIWAALPHGHDICFGTEKLPEIALFQYKHEGSRLHNVQSSRT